MRPGRRAKRERRIKAAARLQQTIKNMESLPSDEQVGLTEKIIELQILKQRI